MFFFDCHIYGILRPLGILNTNLITKTKFIKIIFASSFQIKGNVINQKNNLSIFVQYF